MYGFHPIPLRDNLVPQVLYHVGGVKIRLQREQKALAAVGGLDSVSEQRSHHEVEC
jgi:hypothetical protein